MRKTRHFVRKTLLALLLFAGLACGSLQASERCFPVFEKADIFSPVIGTVPACNPVSQNTARRTFSVRHPMAWVVDMTPCNLSDGRTGYVSQDVQCPSPEKRDQIFYTKPAPYFHDLLLCLGLGVLLCVPCVLLMRKRKNQLTRTDALFGAAALLIAIRILLLVWSLNQTQNIIPSAADDPGYFETARGMLTGNWRGPWSFTIGNGFFYMPFILVLNACSFYDIALAYDYFSGFVLGPLLLLVGFMVLRKLRFDLCHAFAALFLAAIWPFFFFHLENWSKLIFPAYIAWPNAGENLHHAYRIMIGSGFNAMSDTPAAIVVLASIGMAATMKKELKLILLLGVLFGFGCMIRINNIFYAPVLAYLVLRDMQFRRYPAAAGMALAGFLLGFGLQMAVNCYQFGNPFTFGYILHYPHLPLAERPVSGFTWHTFLRGAHIKFLSGANLPLWSLGIAGLLCMKDTRTRTVLALWSVPVIFFFFGYSHTFCDAVRFILPTQIAFFAAFISVWHKDHVRDIILCCAIASGIFLVGNAYLTAGLLAVILLRALYDWAREARLKFRVH